MSRHLLGIESLSLPEFEKLLSDAEAFVEVSERDIKKVPSLRGKTVINFFMEPSTRTRTSFEIAGKRLSADTVNISGSGSSVVKGESLFDTARTLQSMSPNVVVIRHKCSGAAEFMAKHLENVSVVNAGDGMHEHPTQALLDCLTLRRAFKSRGKEFKNIKIAIVGDVRHSRVVRSNIWAHRLLENEVRIVSPPTLVPPEFSDFDAFKMELPVFHNVEEGIDGVDVIMCLRMQLERQNGNFVPDLEEYSREYCITADRVKRAAPEALILHPGPVNRGVELDSSLMDTNASLIEEQVKMGVAVRMAVLFNSIMGGSE